VAQLHNELFVLQKSSPQLSVYDAVSFTARGNIIIPAAVCRYARNFVDMVACHHYHCLYLADQSTSHIVRLEIPPKHSKWEVDGIDGSTALSVTSSHHVLVSCGGVKLKLFSTDGELHNTVELQSDLIDVTCAVEFMPGQYVVTHGSDSYTLHRTSMVNSEGKILHTFGGLQGSYGKLLDTPRDVAVDKDGFVYVDDEGNNRLVVLTPSLDYIDCMPNVFTKSSDPFIRRMKLDKKLGHMYVVHSSDSTYEGRGLIHYVTVFQI